MNPAYIRVLSALAGSLIGGMTAVTTTWLVEPAQLRNAFRQSERTKLETNDFINEAARLFFAGRPLHQEEVSTTNMMRLYTLVEHMRVVSARPDAEQRRCHILAQKGVQYSCSIESIPAPSC